MVHNVVDRRTSLRRGFRHATVRCTIHYRPRTYFAPDWEHFVLWGPEPGVSAEIEDEDHDERPPSNGRPFLVVSTDHGALGQRESTGARAQETERQDGSGESF